MIIAVKLLCLWRIMYNIEGYLASLTMAIAFHGNIMSATKASHLSNLLTALSIWFLLYF